MSERAQALEALHKEIDWMLGGVGGTDSLTISAAILMRWRRTLAPAEGVNPQPPSPAGSPTTEDDRALIAACSPYLKDGETPAQCIARNRADIDSVLTLLAQAKQTVQHLATCATNGHIYGHTGACIFCGEPKFSPVEPTPEPPTCGARHQMTGIVCELPRGHAENHRGEDSHCSSQWPKDEPKAHREPAPCVWRDIASAPKDGTTVLLFHKGAMEPDYVTVAEYVTFETSEHHYRSGWCSADTGQYVDDSGVPPTYWMPLPAPPREGD